MNNFLLYLSFSFQNPVTLSKVQDVQALYINTEDSSGDKQEEPRLLESCRWMWHSWVVLESREEPRPLTRKAHVINTFPIPNKHNHIHWVCRQEFLFSWLSL